MKLKPHERLREARINAGHRSAAAASAAFGWPQKTYYVHEKGLASFRNRVNEYAAAFNVTAEYLIGNEDYIEIETPLWNMPILDLADMDAFTTILRGKLPETTASLFPCGPLSFGIKNPNRAMTSPQNPRILPGDILVFDPNEPAREGDFILARVAGEYEPLFRAYTKLSGGAYSLAPLNPMFAPRIVSSPGDMQIIGRLAFVITNADTLS